MTEENEDRRSDHPIQTDPPYRFDDEEDVIAAALKELEHFIWRADTPPDKSTLDPNLNRCREHLNALLRDAQEDSGVESKETERVLMAVEESWTDDADHVHIELFAPSNRFEDLGVPEEAAIMGIPSNEPRDWSLHTGGEKDDE